ncbi:hypothetical protein KM043_006019 [Ampulex compressa]|nr:hypothetical protein KM043_006019 [Ampulex compressa]
MRRAAYLRCCAQNRDFQVAQKRKISWKKSRTRNIFRNPDPPEDLRRENEEEDVARTKSSTPLTQLFIPNAQENVFAISMRLSINRNYVVEVSKQTRLRDVIRGGAVHRRKTILHVRDRTSYRS